MKTFYRSILFVFCISIVTYSQNPLEKRIVELNKAVSEQFIDVNDLSIDEVKAIPTLIRGELLTNINLQNIQDLRKVISQTESVFRMDSQNDAFLIKEVVTDELGMTHSKMEQSYKGVKVFGGEVIFHNDSKNVLTEISGKYIPDLDLAVTPQINSDRAIQIAMNEIGNAKYRWENESSEANIKEVYNDPNATWKPQPELCIAPKNGDYDNGEFKLAWHFVLAVDSPEMANYNYFVDASTGEIINKYNTIYNADATGSGVSNYYGTVSFKSNSITGGYQMYDITKNIKTFDLNYQNPASAVVIPANPVSDTDNNWNATTQKVYVDAHWAASKAYDYYKSIHGRNSFDNAGAMIKVGVHLGTKYVNAFWDGAELCFGDGDGVQASALTVLDILGHELTHAVTQKTANLIYQNESGALNEGFSDIFGAAIEFYGKPTGGNWMVGEDCWTPGTSGDAARYMDNPKRGSQPNTYQGTYWKATTSTPGSSNDYGGVHKNNSVLNYAFYLISAGGSGTNDKGTAYKVTGITIAKAQKIAYRALTTYLVSSSNFSACREAFLSATKDLYGNAGQEYRTIQDAFMAVGIGAGAPAAGTTGEVEANNTTSTANIIASYPTVISGTIGTSTDADYFKVTINAGKNIVLSMTVPADKNYDVYMYNSSYALVAKSINGTGMAESINYTSSTTRVYYIKVCGVSSAYGTSPYTLTLTMPNGIRFNGEEDAGGVSDYELFQNYPNPFNPSTQIKFSLPEVSRVSMKVYGILGEEVATLLNDVEYGNGIHQVEWAPDNLSSGIYIYRLTAKSQESTREFSVTKKMQYVR